MDGSDEEKIAFCMKRKKEMFETFHRETAQGKISGLGGYSASGQKPVSGADKREINKSAESSVRATTI